MSEINYEDYVFSLDEKQFNNLKAAVDKRIDRNLFAVTSFEQVAVKYQRKPACPNCQSIRYHEDGYTMAGHRRYWCEDCNSSYILLSDSIFNSAKIPFHKLMGYIALMSFSVPLKMCCEILDIADNTAELWRKKIFKAIDGYQDHLKLYNTVWIDETYIEDYEVLIEDEKFHPRGLSKTKICIVVGIDIYKNMVAIIS